MLPSSRPLSVAVGLLLGAALLAGCSSDDPSDDAAPEATPESGAPESPEPSAATEPAEGGGLPDSVSLTMHPQLAQVGARPAASSAALSSMTVQVQPARSGEEVVLQAKRSDSWTEVEVGKQDEDGIVELNAPYAVDDEVQTYRATVAGEGEGDQSSVSSEPVRTDSVGAASFTDEFGGTSLSAAWSDRLQGYSEVSGRVCSKADGQAAEVSGGTLKLRVLLDPERRGDRCRTEENGTHDYRLNGHVSTQQSRAFEYGYFAARIKFQELRGQHGAFWLQPQSRAVEIGSATQTGAEIDVIEWFGRGQPQGGLTSFVYDRPDEDGRKIGDWLKSPDQYGGDWSAKYHVFSVEWTPERYVFRIDGQETFRTSKGVSGRPQYLILSLLSSDYELGYIENNKLPQTMSVDWVRHWGP